MLEQATEVVAPAESGLAGSVVGPSEVRAQRVVIGDPDDAARALIEWFDKNELLAVQRQQSGRVTFEPIGGMQAALRRGGAVLGSGGPKFMLAKAKLVAATFTRLESGYCHVSLTADLRATRAGYVGGAVALGSVGASAAIILAMLSPIWFVVIPPLMVGGAAAGSLSSNSARLPSGPRWDWAGARLPRTGRDQAGTPDSPASGRVDRHHCR